MGIPRGRGNILPASGGGKLKGAKIWSVMRCACKCDAIRQVQALRRCCRRSPETENEALPNRRAHAGKVIDAGANDYTTKLENAHETEFRELYIRGIRGPALASAFTSRSKSRTASSFAVACAADGLRFQPGCSIGLHAPGCVLQLMPMST